MLDCAENETDIYIGAARTQEYDDLNANDLYGKLAMIPEKGQSMRLSHMAWLKITTSTARLGCMGGFVWHGVLYTHTYIMDTMSIM